VLVGLFTSLFILFCVKAQALLDITSTQMVVKSQIWMESHLHVTLPVISDWVGWIPGMAAPLKPEEVTQAFLIVTAFGVIIVSMAWFFFTSLFYQSSSPEYQTNLDKFFSELKRPIEGMTVEQVKENTKVVGSIGWLCVIFGAFVLLMMFIPNAGTKRLAFLFSGGCIFTVGWFLQRISNQKPRGTPPPPPAPAKSLPVSKS
jgi:hypothetical protein